jgi:outer membrane protein assembly factor BamB
LITAPYGSRRTCVWLNERRGRDCAHARTSTLLIAAVERSKVPFFVAGAVLVVWALASAAVGTRRSSFPGKRAGLAAYLTATVALVLTTMALAVVTSGTDPAPPWDSANGDLRNHRVATGSEITASNVRELGVAWTMPLTASSIYGTFAANPVTDAHGVVYLQDLQSNVFAVDLKTGAAVVAHLQLAGHRPERRSPRRTARSTGDRRVRLRARRQDRHASCGATRRLVPSASRRAGGELASGFGIDIQPQVANGPVYLSTAALLGGGIVYALDASTGRTSGRSTRCPTRSATRSSAAAPGTRRRSAPTGRSTSARGTCTSRPPSLSTTRASASTPTACSRSTARPGS